MVKPTKNQPSKIRKYTKSRWNGEDMEKALHAVIC